MPNLNGITCRIELSGSNLPLREHQTSYVDGLVQTFVAVPGRPTEFSVHLTTNGYIAPGICMFVFMDGAYQCNRYRRGLVIPSEGTPTELTWVDLRVRQKEEPKSDGRFIGRGWTFEKLNTVSADQAPNTNPDVIGNIGTIEVVVLRLAEAAGQNEVQSTHKSKAANNSQLKAKTRPDVLKGAAQRETFDVRSAMESFSALFDGSADEGYRRIGPYDESWGGRDHLRRWNSLSRRPERYDFPLGPRDSSENAPRRRSEYRYDQYDSARRNLDSGRQGYPSVHGHSRTGHPLTGYENNHFPRLPHENYGHEVPNHWYPNNNSEYPYRTLTHQIPLRAERSGHGGRDRRTHHDIRDFDGPSYPSPYHQPGRLVRPMLHEFEARQQAGDIPPNRPYGANYGRPSAWENRWEEYPRTRATFSYGDELYRPTLPDPALRDEAPRRRFTHREHGPGNYPGSPPPWKSYTKHLGRGHQSRAYDPYEPDTWQREGHASGISNGSSNGYGSGESKDSIDNHNGRPSRRYKWHSRHHTWDGRQERPSNRNEKGSWSHNVHRGATGNQGRWSNGNAGGWNDNNQAGGNNEDQAGWNNGGSGGRNYETHQQSNHNNPEVQNEGHQGGWNNNSPDQPNNENQGDANGNNPNNWNGGNQVGWNSNSPGRKNNDDRGGWNTGSAGQLNNNDQGYNAEDNHGGRWDDSSKHKHKSKQNKDGNRKSSRMGSGRSRESSTDMGSQGNRKSSSSQGNNERPNSNDGQWNTNQNNNGQWNTSNAEVAPKLPTIHSEGPLKLEIKPYWTSWQKAKKESSADKKKLSRAELVYTEPEEPLHVIPEKTAREKQVDHQVKIGRGAAYWHQVGRPEYLDTMEAPYAVFSFKYRSKETLEQILGEAIVEPPEDYKRRMLALSKEELVNELVRAKGPQGDDKSVGAGNQGQGGSPQGWNNSNSGNACAAGGGMGGLTSKPDSPNTGGPAKFNNNNSGGWNDSNNNGGGWDNSGNNGGAWDNSGNNGGEGNGGDGNSGGWNGGGGSGGGEAW